MTNRILSLVGISAASVLWMATAAAASSDIVDTAAASKKFPTLVKAVEAAGLIARPRRDPKSN